MSSQKNIQDELKALESSLSFNNNQPFSVPEGYFGGLAAAILAKVKGSEVSAEAELGELSPLLAGIPKITPYSVPFSYFSENLDDVPGILQEPDLVVLNYVGKELPYAVPQGYFENLPEQILERISEPKAKVVPLFARTWMKMAAAAVVTGALIFGGLQLFSGKPDEIITIAVKQTDSTQTAQNNKPVLKEIKQASTKELEEFIETVQVTAANTNGSIASNKGEVEDLLKDVSTNEMETFLSELSTDDDLALTD